MAIVLARRLDNAIWWYTVGIIFFSITMSFYSGWAPIANGQKFRHTYFRSSPPGTLTSDRGTFRFVSFLLIVLLWWIPVTAALMIGKPGESSYILARTILLAVLFIWFFITFIFGIVDYVNRNKTNVENFGNPANDKRWCCLHYNLPGADLYCPNFGTDANDGTCNPGVGVGDLTIDPDFAFAFWFNFALILFILLDFFYMMLVFRPEVLRYARQVRQHASPNGQPLMTKKVVP